MGFLDALRVAVRGKRTIRNLTGTLRPDLERLGSEMGSAVVDAVRVQTDDRFESLQLLCRDGGRLFGAIRFDEGVGF